ncbi:MAG: hypothetical protein GY756_21395 [bacterium]|nr:hypothetical protein [bacterium]
MILNKLLDGIKYYVTRTVAFKDEKSNNYLITATIISNEEYQKLKGLQTDKTKHLNQAIKYLHREQ